jgi:hypothetical protein
MRRSLVLALILIGLMAPVALAQQLYTNERVDYTFEIPSAGWRDCRGRYDCFATRRTRSSQATFPAGFCRR